VDKGSRKVHGLDWWENSERRERMKQILKEQDNVDAGDVIMSPSAALERGMHSTLTFPTGNIAPEGSIIKSASIDPEKIDEDGVYYHKNLAKVFTSERQAIKAINNGEIFAGDIMVVTGCGPLGTGMEETYQLTSALKHLSFGKHVTLLTDARFSGVSTGACIGHIGPEGLANGPIGKLRTGDLIEVYIHTKELQGHLHFLGTPVNEVTPEEGSVILAKRPINPDVKPSPQLPDDTKLWAALQSVSGGTWNGSIYDVDRIIEVLKAGEEALKIKNRDGYLI
jgi:dihydroxyacid dehydratase/phosphogluconate dehydratase